MIPSVPTADMRRKTAGPGGVRGTKQKFKMDQLHMLHLLQVLRLLAKIMVIRSHLEPVILF